jgi:hypothetical protein
MTSFSLKFYGPADIVRLFCFRCLIVARRRKTSQRLRSEEFKRVHRHIPWTQIAGLRNRIVHDYFGLDLEIIWEISNTICPSLRNKSALSKVTN